MDEANRPGTSMAELLGATWRVWRSHAVMFFLLMAIPIGTLLLMALIVNFVIAPHPEGTRVMAESRCWLRCGWGWSSQR